MRHQSLAETPSTWRRSADNDLPVIVIEYLHRLRRLPVGSWADAARTLEEAERHGRARPASDSIAAAHASLRRIVADMPGLAVQTQRRVQNMVEVALTCLHTADGTMMRRAALAAALALATRESLGEQLFARLYAPFEELIPLAELEAAPEDALMAPV